MSCYAAIMTTFTLYSPELSELLSLNGLEWRFQLTSDKHAYAFMTETEPLLFPIMTTWLNMVHDLNGPSERKRKKKKKN